MKFLVVEDNQIFAQVLVQVLTQHQYLADLATDGEMGKAMAEAFSYDLILLDYMLPKLDGLDVCKQLRSAGNQTPIILMSARGSGPDKISGLDAGADDYLVKPFDFEELLARIRAILRRNAGNTSPMLHWGELCLDPGNIVVSVRKVPISLTPKEYALLELFLRNPSRIFSVDNLLDKVWSFEKSPGAGCVRTHIKGLRQKLKDVNVHDIIENVYGLGYRLKLPEPPRAPAPMVPVSGMNSPMPDGVLEEPWAFWHPLRSHALQRVGEMKKRLQGLIERLADVPVDRPIDEPVNEPVQQQIALEVDELARWLSGFGFYGAAIQCQTISEKLRSSTSLSAYWLQQLIALGTAVEVVLAKALPQTLQDLARLLGLAQRQNQCLCLSLIELLPCEATEQAASDVAVVNDYVVNTFADQLRTTFRGEDIVSRWGRHRFLMGLYGVDLPEGMQRLAQFLARWQQVSLTAGEVSVQSTFAAGVAVSPQHGIDLSSLYDAADSALTQAKVTAQARIQAIPLVNSSL
ncbi:MAG: response regulator [Cyanobacteria bacterium P01_A01_bin.116]